MLKKYLPGTIVAILLYLLFHLPARLLEHWFLSEVLEQVEAKGWSFLILWVMPLLVVISLTAIGYYIWNLIKGYKTKAQGEYQPQSVSKITITTHAPSVTVGKAGGLVYDLNTINKKNRLLEAQIPIQAVRFTKPKDVVVRPTFLPVVIECESSFWKRIRNKLLSVPNPRIIVKRFTEKGVVWDEENTTGADIFIEFYAK